MAIVLNGTTGITQPNVTGAFGVAVGTTAQRPSSPATGMIRYNTTESQYEVYDGSNWNPLTQGSYSYSVEYLVIAGGAGGARSNFNGSGGGGAGGYRCSVTGESSGGGGSAESALSVTAGTAYTVTIGAGGAAVTTQANGNNGSNSVFATITSLGGGGGGINVGLSGGSGGGGGNNNAAGGGTAGQGFIGAASGDGGAGGGGGGAGGAGGQTGPISPLRTNGGVGVASTITGSSVTRALGGVGNGGSGVVGPSAAANTGSGGGGAFNGDSGSGGSGVVIIRYAGSQRGTGGTVTSSGGYTIHTFTTSGTYTA